MRLRYAGLGLLLVTAACVPMSRVPLQATPGALEILTGKYALSTFDGRLEANVVEGTFTTTSACGAGDVSGTWKATKKRVKASQARR